MSYRLGWIDESIVKRVEDFLKQAKLPTASTETMTVDMFKFVMATEEFKKLKDLKVVSDDIGITKMLESDIESNQKKISAWKNLKHQTLTQGGDNISNGFNTPVVPNSFVSPSSLI
ncbi:hypothetical protein RJT34_11932 [Clitoria ternatea]|uniref:Uncharacterized protein n=1 Tax=Clitoria ternatea TaxID=43366 RepID=A0AAN9JLB2_CLITE